jgi:hypothetical protein
MKTFKIEVPNGYEIDKEKSTFENIVFKEVSIGLPKDWYFLEEISGFFINHDSSIGIYSVESSNKTNRHIFAKYEQARASLALAQLSQLREVYRNGWKPDWKDNKEKYCIYFNGNKIQKEVYFSANVFLSFQDKETRDLFLENFRDLIEQAKTLMS